MSPALASALAITCAFASGFIIGTVRTRMQMNAEREARTARLVALTLTDAAPYVPPLFSWTLHPHGHLTSYATIDQLMPRVVEEADRG